MVKLAEVTVANERMKTFKTEIVAVFVGGTSGIAESTAKAFCKYALKPKVYLVGRNGESANRIMSELRDINSSGTYDFIQEDVSLLSNVDRACKYVKARESTLNLLFMTSGTMSLKGRDETSEGIDKKLVTNYYARMRFTQQLLPLLEKAAPLTSRVVSVLAPGTESASFNTSDLGLKDTFSLSSAANHAVVMTDFCFENFALKSNTVSFIHSSPGIVKTGFAKEQNFLMRAAMNLAAGVLTPWTVPLVESGERHMYLVSSGKFPSKDGSRAMPVTGREGPIMEGSDGLPGSGAYLVGEHGDFKANREVLRKLRDDGRRSLIWEHTMNEFDRVCGHQTGQPSAQPTGSLSGQQNGHSSG